MKQFDLTEKTLNYCTQLLLIIGVNGTLKTTACHCLQRQGQVEKYFILKRFALIKL